ncbi:WG repeat-containing protein [Chryseobacterium sp. JAH]|uniref:WG repeat-containing protein n=1 Tax=Chryseobacterium sp. JAH TaxID=1742858 RepID=UPI000740DA24|nr:WG repeat-containing protein [Chryseobacterium sp. JAH]KUJ51771.1 hypothetical protein AR685_09020 [Chryseobacterium sp. JAH]
MKNLVFILFSGICIAQSNQYKEVLLSKKLGNDVSFYSKGYGIVSDSKIGSSSIVDSLGNLAFTSPFKNEIIRIAKNDRFILKIKEGKNAGKTALIDGKGNLLIPFDNFKYRTWENKDRLIYSKGGIESVYDFDGKQIIPFSDKIEFASESRFFVKNKGWYIYDFDGQLINDREFDQNFHFYKGRVYISTGVLQGEILDFNGNTISSISNHNIDDINAFPFLITKNMVKNKYGIVDQNENILAEETYEQAFVGTEYIYLIKKGKVSIFSKKDRNVYPTDFSYVNHLFEGIFKTSQDFRNPKSAIVNIKGEILLPKEYDVVERMKIAGKNYIYLQKGREKNLLDENLKSALNDNYTIERRNGNMLILKKDHTFYQFSPDTKNYKVLKNVFAVENWQFSRGLICQNENNLYGILDEEGNEIVPFMYDAINVYFSANEIVVKKEGKYGVINYKNEPLKEIIYDKYSSDRKGLKLTKEKEAEYLDFTYPERKIY